MKKKIIIPIIICLILIIGIICFILLNNRVVSKITLDINPSIELDLDKNNKVLKVKALNKDAEDIINKDYKNKSIKKELDILLKNTLEKVNINNGNMLWVIVYTEGDIDNQEVVDMVEGYSKDKGFEIRTYTPDKITKEDKKLAKKYNITVAKANYLNSIKKKYKDIDINDLVNRSVEELEETRTMGRTCPDGYYLQGDECKKEIKRYKAKMGMTCPGDYFESNGKCYKEGNYKEKEEYICHEGFTYNGSKCEREETRETEAKCSEGEYDFNIKKCVVKKLVGEAKLYCRITPSEDLLYGTRCLGRKPTINGGCLGSDKVINGWCYDTSANSGYEAEYRCPSGELRSIKDAERDGTKCYDTTEIEPDEIYCPKEYELIDNKCFKIDYEDPFHERYCDSGYTLTEEGRCLKDGDVVEAVQGLLCEEIDSELVGKECVLYKKIDPVEH